MVTHFLYYSIVYAAILLFQKTFQITFDNIEDRNLALKYLKRGHETVMENDKLFDLKKVNYRESLYKFSHLSEKSFRASYLGFVPKPLLSDDEEPDVLIQSRVDPSECSSIPDYKNWSEEGKVTPIKSQAPCSSCYIFAATSAIESAVAIEYNLSAPIALSTQHILQCVKNMTNGNSQGCEGGTPELIWRYSRDQGGLVGESSFKLYDGNPKGDCVPGLDRVAVSAVEYWGKISSGNEEAMKCFIAKYGVLSVTISTINTSFEHYIEGIFDDYKGECTANKSVDHVRPIFLRLNLNFVESY